MDAEQSETRIELRDFVDLSRNVPGLDISIREFATTMQEYRAGISEITTKFKILDEDFKVRLDRNPIHTITSRLKSPRSLLREDAAQGPAPHHPQHAREPPRYSRRARGVQLPRGQ